MWLLSTDRAELHWFRDASSVIGGYAILSHTWGRDEQTFQDIEALGERCKADGTNPRDFVSDKIRGCCILAEHHGYAWAWVDSSCIDKTSSSELSESINSMFQWYTQAGVCYVYMADVPDKCDIHPSGSAFRKSRWHTRGWTLQELIAPTIVIFLSRHWTFLGRRDDSDVAALLEDITWIPTSILMCFTQVHEYSIATRMSWASSRNTTRIEDEAYCLMGLFGVNMPTIYGEGQRAFQRLQLEIMKDSSDTSLFVWGDRVSDAPLETQGFRARSSRRYRPYGPSEDYYLLAQSPRNFKEGVYFTLTKSNPLQDYPPTDRPARRSSDLKVTGLFDRVELPKFSSTSYGIKCRFPVIVADGYTIAVLFCETDHDHLGLLLHEDTSGRDPTRPRYFTDDIFPYTDLSKRTFWIARIVTLGSDLDHLHFNGKVVEATWHTFYVVPNASKLASPPAYPRHLQLLEHDLGTALRIPPWLIATFATLGFTERHWLVGTSTTDQAPAQYVFFRHVRSTERIHIELGLCQHPSASASMPRAYHLTTQAPWARISPRSVHQPPPWMDSWSQRPPHKCDEDHIDTWPMRTKIFSNRGRDGGEPERAVCISFDSCRLSPEKTLIVHVELLGPVYEKILRDANISIPTFDELSVGSSTTALAALPLSSTGGVSMPPPSVFTAPAVRPRHGPSEHKGGRAGRS